MYDVYLTTGGAKLVGGGSDVWIRYWADYIAPNLDIKPVLMVDRPDPDPSRPADLPYDIDVLYRDDEKEWWDMLDGASRIHVLHMYYHERDSIKKNLDKINSIALHVCTEQSLSAAKELGLSTNKFHHIADDRWEKSIIPHIPNPIWIGVNEDTPFHRDFDHIVNIPNLYVFQSNSELVYSDVIGYAARIENRKCPHYLDGLESECFTNYKLMRSWESILGDDFSKARIYKFSWQYINRFYAKPTWGIFHACYRSEPFGYSVFQAADYGKIPILEDNWDKKLDYPFRAHDKNSFNRSVENIRKLSKEERSEVLQDLKTYLKSNYGDPTHWVDQYLKIYNS